MTALRAGFTCLALVAAGCSTPPPAAPSGRTFTQPASGFTQTPPFSRLGYAPFSRGDVVAIALREWRLWGAPVDDDPLAAPKGLLGERARRIAKRRLIRANHRGHLGAEVGEHPPRERTWTDALELDDAQAQKRTNH